MFSAPLLYCTISTNSPLGTILGGGTTVALVAVYLGETDEAKIDNMSYRFFNSILHQLNRKLRYEAAVGYAGNSFFKESNKLIEESNPLAGENKGPNSSYGEQMAALLNSGQIKVVKRKKQDKENDDFGIVFGENNSN